MRPQAKAPKRDSSRSICSSRGSPEIATRFASRQPTSQSVLVTPHTRLREAPGLLTRDIDALRLDGTGKMFESDGVALDAEPVIRRDLLDE